MSKSLLAYIIVYTHTAQWRGEKVLPAVYSPSFYGVKSREKRRRGEGEEGGEGGKGEESG